MNLPFWENKKVLLTGHTGFKGSWLTLWLHALGAKICGIALEPKTDPNLFEILRLSNDIESHIIDIADYDRLSKVIEAFKPEIVIHMAAQPLVRYSYQHPVETYRTNVMGTVHVFEALRLVSPRAIVCVTTDKCYENREWVWGYRESEPLGGLDPYSNSKACTELISQSYRHSFFKEKHIPLATARSGNVLGGGDWSSDRIIPDLIRAKINNEPLVIRHPSAIRPWQHVLDPLSGYLLLAEKLFDEGEAFAEAWNFGPEPKEVHAVSEIVQRVAEQWDLNYQLGSQKMEPHEAMSLRLDIEKARRFLGWRPRWSFEKVIEETMAWYQAWFDAKDMRAFSLSQIEGYQSTVLDKAYA